LIIEDDERKRRPIEPPDTIDAIRYRMETAGYAQADLGRLLGSHQRTSDILTRKRSVTMRMTWKLHRERDIPAEALITPADAWAKVGRVAVAELFLRRQRACSGVEREMTRRGR